MKIISMLFKDLVQGDLKLNDTIVVPTSHVRMVAILKI
jgi:hypothetical protein